MDNKTKAKSGNTAVLIICSIIFIILWFVQGRMNARENPEVKAIIDYLLDRSKTLDVNLDGAIGPLRGMSRGGSSISGLIAQMQVMLSAIMVLTNKKRGFITAVLLNLFNLGFIVFFTMIISKNFNSIPGEAV